MVLGAPLPLSETVAVGIDLGTTRSVIAVYVKGNTVVITHDNLQKSLPSCVAWLETGEQSVGDYCLSLAQKNPTRVVMNSKRILGRM